MMKKFIPIVIVFVMMLVPAMAIGASVEGSVQGLTCVTQDKVCPVGSEDPMVAAERTFVVHVRGAEYYLVPNLDRAILARHIGEMVKVDGVKSTKFKSIHAKTLYVKKSGKWVSVWSQKREDDIRDSIFHDLRDVK
jgi:hypothetical protein